MFPYVDAGDYSQAVQVSTLRYILSRRRWLCKGSSDSCEEVHKLARILITKSGKSSCALYIPLYLHPSGVLLRD